MLYRRLAEYYERIEATPKRLEMTQILVELFREVPVGEMERVVYLTQGRVLPDFRGVELGLAEKMALRALQGIADVPPKELSARAKEAGDLGTLAGLLLETRRQRPLHTEPLTVNKVYGSLLEIAESKGEGSQEIKVRLLSELVADSSPLEARYLLRTVVGKLRLGTADMTMIDALSAAFAGKEDRDQVERAYSLCSDLGKVARVLASGGLKALARIKLEVGVPMRPMLCERAKEIPEIFERIAEPALEFKYDGLRLQGHIRSDKVRLFSRQLEDVTAQFPDVVEGLKESYRGKTGVVEGEAVPVDPNTGEFLPFQMISHRRGRIHGVEEAIEEFPVTLYLFDCLARDGEDLTQRPYTERRKTLQASIRGSEKVVVAEAQVTQDPKAAEAFFNRALAQGCEGFVAKDPASTYEAGARGWLWIKFKSEYRAEMSDNVDLVVVGAFAGRGKRGGTYGALLMAAYDKKAGVYCTTCKLGTGFDDETLFALPQRLARHKVRDRPNNLDSEMEAEVWFDPRIVLEVRGAEITLSPVHTAGKDAVRPGAGFAIRFPRFTGRWREDKGPEDATTVGELTSMYQRQSKTIK